MQHQGLEYFSPLKQMSTVSSYIGTRWLLFSQKIHPAVTAYTLSKAVLSCTFAGSAVGLLSTRVHYTNYCLSTLCFPRMLLLEDVLALFRISHEKSLSLVLIVSNPHAHFSLQPASRWTNIKALKAPDIATINKKHLLGKNLQLEYLSTYLFYSY